MSKFKKIIWNSILLSFFVTMSVVNTIFFYNYTKDKIFFYIANEKKRLLQQILPKKMYLYFNFKLYKVKNRLLGDKKVHDLWLLCRQNKIKAAVVESIAPDGYSGSIHILVGAYLNGKIIGVRVLLHHETPGIGDKIELSVSNWIKQFSDMFVLNNSDNRVLLKKFGGQIEQFTGATITPQAVTNAIKRTVIFIKNIKSTDFK